MKVIRDLLGPEDDPGHAAYVARTGNSYDVEPPVAANMVPLLLIGKLHEEAEEIRESMTDPVEYADALQVLMDLATLNAVPWSEIEHQRREKEVRKGGFLRGKVLRKEA